MPTPSASAPTSVKTPKTDTSVVPTPSATMTLTMSRLGSEEVAATSQRKAVISHMGTTTRIDY